MFKTKSCNYYIFDEDNFLKALDSINEYKLYLNKFRNDFKLIPKIVNYFVKILVTIICFLRLQQNKVVHFSDNEWFQTFQLDITKEFQSYALSFLQTLKKDVSNLQLYVSIHHSRYLYIIFF